MKQTRISPHKVTIETRADGSKVIHGYGAVFFDSADAGTQYELWPGCMERIDPRAFDASLSAKEDVRGLFNHDPNCVLGRVVAGTMRLFADTVGLRYEIDIPDTQVGRDTATSIERGDISGSSFSFSPRSIERVRGENGGPDLRVLKDVQLYDVGPVVFPAYESTTAGVRSESGIEETRKEHEAWQRQKDKDFLQSLE